MKSRDSLSTSTSTPPRGAVHPAGGGDVATTPETTHPASCPHLGNRCTKTGAHDMHWGAENTIPAVRPDQNGQPLAVAQLFSVEDQAGAEDEPTLSVGLGPFDGDLTLAQADQLLAGVKAFGRRLEAQIAQLEAARREWEAAR